MTAVYEGCSEPYFPIKKEGKVLIISESGVYNGKYELSYREKTTYTFNSEEEANQYYYAKLQVFKQDPHNFKI